MPKILDIRHNDSCHRSRNLCPFHERNNLQFTHSWFKITTSKKYLPEVCSTHVRSSFICFQTHSLQKCNSIFGPGQSENDNGVVYFMFVLLFKVALFGCILYNLANFIVHHRPTVLLQPADKSR